jgi:hypothetical protein
MRFDIPGYIYEEIATMNTLAALLARIEYLSAENRDLSRQVEAYREDYAARQSESKAPSRRTRAAAKRG